MENAEGYFLTAEQMQWFRAQYFASDTDEGNIYALPRRAADLSELPPATVVTAGFDPLCDEGAAYVDRLEADGNAVEHRHYEAQIHGFCSLYEHIDEGRAAIGDVAESLRSTLAE